MDSDLRRIAKAFNARAGNANIKCFLGKSKIAHTAEGIDCAELGRWITDECSRPNTRWGANVGTNWESVLAYAQIIEKSAKRKLGLSKAKRLGIFEELLKS